ncbi:MAG: hypothetical protein WBY94_14695 [Polyangiaceae bacterium]
MLARLHDRAPGEPRAVAHLVIDATLTNGVRDSLEDNCETGGGSNGRRLEERLADTFRFYTAGAARNISATLRRYAPEGAREMTMRAGDRTRWAPAPEFVRRSG